MFSVLSLRDMWWTYSTAGAVNEKDLMTVLSLVWNQSMQLNDRPLALSLFAYGHTEVVKQEYTIMPSSADRTCVLPNWQHAWRRPESSNKIRS